MRSCRRRRPRGVAAETVSVGDREHQRPIRHERRHVPARRAPRRARPFRARRPDDARVRGHRSSARSVAIRDSTRSPSSRAHPRRRRRNPSSHGARQSVTRPAHERRSRARGSRATVATSVWTLGPPSKVGCVEGGDNRRLSPLRGGGNRRHGAWGRNTRPRRTTRARSSSPRTRIDAPSITRASTTSSSKADRDGSVSRDAPHYGRPRPRGRGAYVV